jgi:hypothetical protein
MSAGSEEAGALRAVYINIPGCEGSGAKGSSTAGILDIPSSRGGSRSVRDVPVSEQTAAVATRGPGKGPGVEEGSETPMYKSGSDALHALLETS